MAIQFGRLGYTPILSKISKVTEKEIEGRVLDLSKKRKRYQDIVAGDIIHFILRKNGCDIETNYAYRVRDNRHYETIQEMLESETLNQVLPSVKNLGG